MSSLILASRGSSPMPAPLSTAGRSSPSSPTTSSASYSAGTRSFRGFLACTEVDSRNLKTKRVWSRGQGTTRLPLGLLISGKERAGIQALLLILHRSLPDATNAKACITAKQPLRMPAGPYGRAWAASLLLPRLPVRPGRRDG